jgi:hypothetical protein
MAIKVQTHEGTTADANAYASEAAMRAHFTERGKDLSSYNAAAVESALIRATDFMDARYTFIGQRLNPSQGTACPRHLPNGSMSYLNDIHTLEPTYLLTIAQWQAIERACIGLGYRALTSTLMPDPVRDASGQRVLKKSIKAGPVETSKEYSAGKGPDSDVPSYPEIDLLLKVNGLLVSKSGGTISRA